jgi:hypothetical protein
MESNNSFPTITTSCTPKGCRGSWKKSKKRSAYDTLSRKSPNGSNPLIRNRTLDYGAGFYTTTSEQQAREWILRKLSGEDSSLVFRSRTRLLKSGRVFYIATVGPYSGDSVLSLLRFSCTHLK